MVKKLLFCGFLASSSFRSFPGFAQGVQGRQSRLINAELATQVALALVPKAGLSKSEMASLAAFFRAYMVKVGQVLEMRSGPTESPEELNELRDKFLVIFETKSFRINRKNLSEILFATHIGASEITRNGGPFDNPESREYLQQFFSIFFDSNSLGLELVKKFNDGDREDEILAGEKMEARRRSHQKMGSWIGALAVPVTIGIDQILGGNFSGYLMEPMFAVGVGAVAGWCGGRGLAIAKEKYEDCSGDMQTAQEDVLQVFEKWALISNKECRDLLRL